MLMTTQLFVCQCFIVLVLNNHSEIMVRSALALSFPYHTENHGVCLSQIIWKIFYVYYPIIILFHWPCSHLRKFCMQQTAFVSVLFLIIFNFSAKLITLFILIQLIKLPAEPNVVTVLESYIKNFGVNVLCATVEKQKPYTLREHHIELPEKK